MRWLPDYGVGIIAFGNLTYTGWGRRLNAFDAFSRTGALTLRMPKPSPALVEARDAVSRLVVKWDDALADRVAAENLFLDQSKDRRHKAIDDLRAQVGACTTPTSFDIVENALRGSWTMRCERGPLQVAITLAPTTPPPRPVPVGAAWDSRNASSVPADARPAVLAIDVGVPAIRAGRRRPAARAAAVSPRANSVASR
jgi:hypothetical protein